MDLPPVQTGPPKNDIPSFKEFLAQPQKKSSISPITILVVLVFFIAVYVVYLRWVDETKKTQ
jgi:flagellar basal body-associated protein FliL